MRGVAAFGRFGADSGFAAATISLGAFSGVFAAVFLGAVARFFVIVFFADFFDDFFEGFLAAFFAADFFPAFFAVFFTDFLTAFLAAFFDALRDFFTPRFLAPAVLVARAGEDLRALAFFFLEVFLLAFATTNFL
ncbi:hypothetical protein [Bradyrhizobium sp. JYMT SZCCT0428]|uniref:hypothetical protein n=1 Tax=Bradyrhizobium sp. JYMT SZCCT0428 TaxID=2807673 RepID=UPI00289C2083|nr:hypothetical protein [Bradyrhizobium sp. JYMT SZCCT0428]